VTARVAAMQSRGFVRGSARAAVATVAAVGAYGCTTLASTGGAMTSQAARHIPGGYTQTRDAFAGVDKCRDWFTPPPQAGVKVVVCNQSVLTRDIDRALTPPSGDPRIVGPHRFLTATAHELPAQLTLRDATNLFSLRIVARDPVRASVYIAERRAAYERARVVLFRDVPVSRMRLKIVATPGTWYLTNRRGKTVASARPK
jgi:hypothetical protein